MVDLINQEDLKKRFHYNPDTGEFTYLIDVEAFKKGSRVGGLSGNGYWNIRINGYCYKAHRLAWLYMTGSYPLDQIDHIDRDRANNSFSNLREATRSENLMNSKARGNITGFKGVRPSNKGTGFQAHITVNRETIFLGTYTTVEEAAARRQLAEREYFGSFSIKASDNRPIDEPTPRSGIAVNPVTGELYIRPAPNAKDGFSVNVNGTHVGVYTLLQDAIHARNNFKSTGFKTFSDRLRSDSLLR